MEKNLKETEILKDPVMEKLRNAKSRVVFMRLALQNLNDQGRENFDKAKTSLKLWNGLGSVGSIGLIIGASALFYSRSKWTYQIKIPIILISLPLMYSITELAFGLPITYYNRKTILSIVENSKFRISAKEGN